MRSATLLLAAGLEVLWSLKMRGCRYLTDVAVGHLTLVRGSLRELDIGHCNGISGAGLRHLYELRLDDVIRGLAY